MGGSRITRLVAKLIVSRLTSDEKAYSLLLSNAVTRQILMELAERVKCDFVMMNIDDTEIREENLEELCFGLDIPIPGSLMITRQEFETYCCSIFYRFEAAAKLFKGVGIDSMIDYPVIRTVNNRWNHSYWRRDSSDCLSSYPS